MVAGAGTGQTKIAVNTDVVKRVAVVGAAGILGTEVVRLLVSHGVEVTAFVHHAALPKTPQVHQYTGDGRNAEDVLAALDGSDAVVDVVGGGTLRKSNIESTVIINVVSAMCQLKIKRLMAMSAGMVAKTNPILDYILKPTIFRNILAEHQFVEATVKATDLDWTLVRPPRMTSHSPTGYIVSTGTRYSGSLSVSRLDVARFIVDELFSNRFIRQALFLSSVSNRKKQLRRIENPDTTSFPSLIH